MAFAADHKVEYPTRRVRWRYGLKFKGIAASSRRESCSPQKFQLEIRDRRLIKLSRRRKYEEVDLVAATFGYRHSVPLGCHCRFVCHFRSLVGKGTCIAVLP